MYQVAMYMQQLARQLLLLLVPALRIRRETDETRGDECLSSRLLPL